MVAVIQRRRHPLTGVEPDDVYADAGQRRDRLRDPTHAEQAPARRDAEFDGSDALDAHLRRKIGCPEDTECVEGARSNRSNAIFVRSDPNRSASTAKAITCSGALSAP